MKESDLTGDMSILEFTHSPKGTQAEWQFNDPLLTRGLQHRIGQYCRRHGRIARTRKTHRLQDGKQVYAVKAWMMV